MEKGSKHVHDDRYTHADRAEIYESLVKNPKSTLARPEQYARIPLKGMPSPTGKVYRDEEDEFLTKRIAFVSEDYKTHSQFTELYMVQEGLDFSTIDPDYALREAEEAAKRFEEKYSNLENKPKTLKLTKKEDEK